jgi:hypothetical protein
MRATCEVRTELLWPETLNPLQGTPSGALILGTLNPLQGPPSGALILGTLNPLRGPYLIPKEQTRPAISNNYLHQQVLSLSFEFWECPHSQGPYLE